MADLKLPAEISPDGREIWDWADRLSAEVHRRDEVRRLAIQIRNAETQCGSCDDWMTRACPREAHSNKTGRSTGPSSLSIKCGQFRMSALTARELESAREKFAALSEARVPPEQESS